MDAPYGYCPRCGLPGMQRERSPNGKTICRGGHAYPSRDALGEFAKMAMFPGVYVRWDSGQGGYVTNDGLVFKAYEPARSDAPYAFWLGAEGDHA